MERPFLETMMKFRGVASVPYARRTRPGLIGLLCFALVSGSVFAQALASQPPAQPPVQPPTQPPTQPPAQPTSTPPALALPKAGPGDNTPPPGFIALFNGKDLSGWKGLVEDPPKRAAMAPAELASKQQLADGRAKEHWTAQDGVLVFDGKGENLCTSEDFTDFEMYVDWAITPGGDTGIYLRGSPQTNIWDNPEGSGGIYNNDKHARRALINADRTLGEWNTFRIIMTGERVTVYNNGLLVVDDTVLENYWERTKPIYASGAIELQNHGSPLAFKNIYVRKLNVPARPSGPVLKDGDRVAIIGDSITEQRIYSRYIENYLLMCAPQKSLRCFQFGWSGEKAQGIEARLVNDVLAWKPTVATLCYGMNDGGYRAYEPIIGDVFGETMGNVVKAMSAAGVRPVVGTPGSVGIVTFKSIPPAVYNDTLAHLRDVSRELALRTGSPFANVHDHMILAERKAKGVLGENYDVCGLDGVHPRANGHLVMAYAFLKGLGFDGAIGEVVIDLNAGATASGSHAVISAEKGTAVIESGRYPFCFAPAGDGPESPRSILPFIPFNDDLNRFTLRCTNLATPNAKVSWNERSKVFTKEQLERGVNLAAEFLDNPFSEAFAKVDAQIAAKQAFETTVIKEVVTHFRTARDMLANDIEGQASLDGVAAKLRARQATMQDEIAKLVVPVRHTIKVEPQ